MYFFLLTFLLVSNATNVSVLKRWFLGSPRWEGHNEVLLRQQLLWSHLNLSVPLPVKMINSCWPPQLCHQDCHWFNQWVKLPFCYIRSSCVVNFLPQTLPKCPDTLIVPTAEILVLLPRWTFHFPCEEAWKKDRGQFVPDPSPCSQPRHETIFRIFRNKIFTEVNGSCVPKSLYLNIFMYLICLEMKTWHIWLNFEPSLNLGYSGLFQEHTGTSQRNYKYKCSNTFNEK